MKTMVLILFLYKMVRFYRFEGLLMSTFALENLLITKN